MDDSLFPPEWKDVVFNKGNLLPVYIYIKGTQENPCYFDEELSNEDNDDEEMKDNKIDEKNKENIPDNEPPKTPASNKDV